MNTLFSDCSVHHSLQPCSYFSLQSSQTTPVPMSNLRIRPVRQNGGGVSSLLRSRSRLNRPFEDNSLPEEKEDGHGHVQCHAGYNSYYKEGEEFHQVHLRALWSAKDQGVWPQPLSVRKLLLVHSWVLGRRVAGREEGKTVAVRHCTTSTQAPSPTRSMQATSSARSKAQPASPATTSEGQDRQYTYPS